MVIEVARPTSDEALRGTETILFVDDEERIVDISKKILSRIGYTVLTAKNGQEAKEIFLKNKEIIDLVILDMILPDMDGNEIFKILKGVEPKVKVLISSGYIMDSQIETLLKGGCLGFIHKPFEISDLSSKLRAALSKG